MIDKLFRKIPTNCWESAAKCAERFAAPWNVRKIKIDWTHLLRGKKRLIGGESGSSLGRLFYLVHARQREESYSQLADVVEWMRKPLIHKAREQYGTYAKKRHKEGETRIIFPFPKLELGSCRATSVGRSHRQAGTDTHWSRARYGVGQLALEVSIVLLVQNIFPCSTYEFDLLFRLTLACSFENERYLGKLNRLVRKTRIMHVLPLWLSKMPSQHIDIRMPSCKYLKAAAWKILTRSAHMIWRERGNMQEEKVNWVHGVDWAL